MFVRVKTRNNTTQKAVQIVKSIREGSKVKQKVIQTVGYAYDDDTLARLKDVAYHLKTKMEEVDQTTTSFPPEQLAEIAVNVRKEEGGIAQEQKDCLNVDLRNLREKERIILGIHEVYGNIYSSLGFGKVLTKNHGAAARALFHITMLRLAKPASKRASVELLNQDFGLTLQLNTVYRMMDKIDDKVVEKVQKIAYRTTKSLLNNKVSVIFYDCTTLYFESFKPDTLKQNGYSKDGKFNQPQVLLALLVSEAGLPIGYEVFPGSTFEGKTLNVVLQKMKSKYSLERVVFVADSGILSEDNKAYLEKEGIEYILGARLKSLPRSLQSEVLKQENYQSPANAEEEGHKIAEYTYKEDRLIAVHSKTRAEKDYHDRTVAVEKLKKQVAKSKNPKSFLSNLTYKRYLSLTGKSEIEISEGKIKDEAKWDGLTGIITNVKNMSAESIVAHYRSLWQIESCFRVQKHDLKIRPIFHWTPRRVQAHIAICFIAFVCQQYLSYRMAVQSMPLSMEAARNALLHTQASILQDGSSNTYYGIPSKMNEVARKIYKVFGLRYDSTPFLVSKGYNMRYV